MSELPRAARAVVEAAARRGVSLHVLAYPAGTHTAADAARAVGAEVGQIVKSLVFVVDASAEAPGGAPADASSGEPVLALVSGANRVDTAALARVLGVPAVRQASAREVERLTGFTIGGVPPIGHRTELRTVIDEDLERYPLVWAAAGSPTAVFSIDPHSLRDMTRALGARLRA